MLTTDQTSVVGVFADRALMERAINELAHAGFRPEQIEVTESGAEVPRSVAVMGPPSLRARGAAEVGFVAGAIVGGLLGTLIATGVFPGIPSLFDGAGLAALAGAGIGIVLGGLVGALVGWGFMADETSFYARELRAGRILLTVHGDGRSAAAADILRRFQVGGVKVLAPNTEERPV